jgi:hypothetical protein
MCCNLGLTSLSMPAGSFDNLLAAGRSGTELDLVWSGVESQIDGDSAVKDDPSVLEGS